MADVDAGDEKTQEKEEEPMKTETERIKVLAAKELLGERGMVRIDLEGELYTLRITRNGRLILTK